MIEATTAARLRAIRSAGLSRVRRAATRAKLGNVDRDLKIIREIAHGSTYQAAEKSGLSETTVRKILVRYEQIARTILAADAERRDDDGKT